MNGQENEKRCCPRYAAEERFGRHFVYDVATKMEFELVVGSAEPLFPKRCTAFIKNISTEGLCFVSSEQLTRGDRLRLNIFLPESDKRIDMEGEVRWSQTIIDQPRDVSKFDTGITLKTVHGRPVKESVYFDTQYHVEWSSVLDAVFGSYRILRQQKSAGSS